MNKNTKILITGASGFIGSNLLKELINRGYKNISGIDDLSSGNIDNLYNFNLQTWADKNLLVMDLNNSTKYLDKDFKVIFHLSGQPRIQPSIQDPVNTISRNVLGTLFMLEYARNYNCHVIYAGSSSFYGGIRQSPYAWSKHSAGELGFVYSNLYNFPFTEFRFFNVYGSNHVREGKYSTVIGIFEKQYLDKKPLTIVGDGTQKRDYTHVDDIVDGLIKGMENKKISHNKIYDLGTGKNYSILEIAKKFKNNIIFLPQRKGEYPKTLCTSTLAKEDLNWTPTHSLEEYIDAFLSDNK